MKLRANPILAVLAALVLALYPTLAFATAPIRHSSNNGQQQNAFNWSVVGPTDLISFPNPNGADVKMAVQVRCPGQDLASSNNDPANAGGCSSGSYLFLFQIPSAPDNLRIHFKNLVGFTFNDDTSGNPDNTSATVGVLECDPANVAGLCTQLASSGKASEIPDITFTANGANTEVSVLIPSIPHYPAATCPAPNPITGLFPCFPGRGLTLFIQTTQSSPLPIGFPTVKVKTD